MWLTLNKNLKAAGEKFINNHQDAIEPKMSLIFNALRWVKVTDIKVVILGQDPTAQEGKAKGVAFLVDNPRTVPAVLNMLLEVAFEGFAVDLDHAKVEEWLKKGVLLLNAAFTVPHKDKDKDKEQGKAKEKSHLAMWRPFTKVLITYIKDNAPPSAWILWGNEAKEFSVLINSKKHLIVTGRHPSTTGGATGEGNTFFGGNYFNIANQFLYINGRVVIDWSLSSIGRNRLELKLCPQTQKELQQRQNEKQQLINQYQQNQHSINVFEKEITKMQQEQQKIRHHYQSIVNGPKPNVLPLIQPDEQIRKLQHNYDLLENEIRNYQKQSEHLKIQQLQIEEKFKQNLRDQHHLRGLPQHLLKQNYQKQIIVIDEELKKLR